MFNSDSPWMVETYLILIVEIYMSNRLYKKLLKEFSVFINLITQVVYIIFNLIV